MPEEMTVGEYLGGGDDMLMSHLLYSKVKSSVGFSAQLLIDECML